MQQDHLKPLTSLRFFAAFWVVLYTYIHELAGAPSLGLIDKGYLGVDLFFVLSGFILSYCYLDAYGESRFNYGQFAIHRLARVYPLHIATLAFTLLLIAAAAMKGVQLDANAANWAALPAHLTLTQAWGLAPTASFNHPSWSISAEWFAYLSFPAVAFLAWRLREKPILAVSLAIVVLVAINLAFAALAGFNLTRATFQWGALRIVPSFLYGSALYLAWRSGAVVNQTLALASTVLALLTVAAAATFAQSDILIVVALGFLVLSIAGLAPAAGLMSNRVLVYLGEISFATYMIYVPWKWVYLKAANAFLGTEHQPLPLLWWAVGLVALVPLSMLAHHLVERPFRKIVRFYGERVHGSITHLLAKHG